MRINEDGSPHSPTETSKETASQFGPSNKLIHLNKQAHRRSDVDTGPRALHHTLGPGAGQAAPGQAFRALENRMTLQTVAFENPVVTTGSTFTNLDSVVQAVVVPASPSGIIEVHLAFRGSSDTAQGGCLMGFEVRRDGDISGDLLLDATTERVAWLAGYVAGQNETTSWVDTVTDLPTDGELYIRARFRRGVAGTTATFRRRVLTVQVSA